MQVLEEQTEAVRLVTEADKGQSKSQGERSFEFNDLQLGESFRPVSKTTAGTTPATMQTTMIMMTITTRKRMLSRITLE